MAAAWDLNRMGHDVVVFDADDAPGGLAGGFREPEWQWSVERFYHHWFETDHHMLGLIQELGLADQVLFPRPKTVVFHEGDFYPLDSPLAAIRFPGFSLTDVFRFGAVTAWLRFAASWRRLEKVTAHRWMARWYGERLYTTLFEPLLEGKFGPHHHQVNMAWMWARFKTRSTRLGSFVGGFQAFFDAFKEQLEARGVEFRLGVKVHRVETENDRQAIRFTGRAEHFDKTLLTTSPVVAAILAPQLAEHYGDRLTRLESMGAVVIVLALTRPLSREGYYWYNIPKRAGFPYLALVEHTNFMPSEHFGGDHVVYCGDYLPPDHEYFDLSKDDLVERFLPSFERINPDFDPTWVRSSWLYRTRYAQPVPKVGHSQNILPIRTQVSGLFLASMSQVYPWDRGTNFAVEIGRRAARLIDAG